MRFTYAFYEVAWVVDRGFIPLENTPIGHLVTSWVSFYSRNIGPRTVPEVGTEAPPGKVWYEEEDAWSNIWTRRPGTTLRANNSETSTPREFTHQSVI